MQHPEPFVWVKSDSEYTSTGDEGTQVQVRQVLFECGSEATEKAVIVNRRSEREHLKNWWGGEADYEDSQQEEHKKECEEPARYVYMCMWDGHNQ